VSESAGVLAADGKLEAHRALHDGRTQQVLAVEDRELQDRLLLGVSRTFALTIPQLPVQLRGVISNLYLLCRIVDTVEDEPNLSSSEKRRFCAQFVDIIDGNGEANRFAEQLAPNLSSHTIAAEHELIRWTPAIMRVTASFNETQHRALARCVRVMTDGMVEFQQDQRLGGLKNLPELDRYCYHVAGIVGETLTELFCEYSAEIAEHRATLMKQAVSFGQGLQMTNILKDIWDDRERGACWLPREVFDGVGFDLNGLAPHAYQEEFGRGIAQLIGIAKTHLRQAVGYTLCIPKHEMGIRSFCFWAIGFAVLTLHKINRRRDFSNGNQVKISRRSVRLVILMTRMILKHNLAAKALFKLSMRGLPRLPERGV
jgi:farnesyl-diphosphate farnesyltransferase